MFSLAILLQDILKPESGVLSKNIRESWQKRVVKDGFKNKKKTAKFDYHRQLVVCL